MTDLAPSPASGPAVVGEELRDTALMEWLVQRAGGHSVTIVRDGQRMLGWCNGQAGRSFAIADLIDAIAAHLAATPADTSVSDPGEAEVKAAALVFADGRSDGLSLHDAMRLALAAARARGGR